jgi:hypothetical protein
LGHFDILLLHQCRFYLFAGLPGYIGDPFRICSLPPPPPGILHTYSTICFGFEELQKQNVSFSERDS